MDHRHIISAIETSPLNRGLRGADWLASTGNIPVTFENGDIVLFDDEGDGDYEIHVLFKSRGREAIDHVRSALKTMFDEHGAIVIFGMVPVTRRDVKLLARWTGFKSAGTRWTPDGSCELFVLSKSMWKGAVR